MAYSYCCTLHILQIINDGQLISLHLLGLVPAETSNEMHIEKSSKFVLGIILASRLQCCHQIKERRKVQYLGKSLCF